MSFAPEHVETFKNVYRENWTAIKSFNGCRHVELLQANESRNLFFTYSIWESEEHLNAYRESELFKKIWGGTKVLFNDRPQAWSVDELSF